MLQLPNGCSCSEPAIFPKNWDKAGASLKVKWQIQFYFYDPSQLGRYKRAGKFCQVKGGVNRLHSLAERRAAIKFLREETLRWLKSDGFNFITKRYPERSEFDFEVQPGERFIEALTYVSKKLKVDQTILIDFRTLLARLEAAAAGLHILHMPISEIKRRHLKVLLEKIQLKHKLSAYRYNKYRVYLQMLFKELVSMEVVEHNVVDRDFPKQRSEAVGMRQTLTPEERRRIDAHLRENNYIFWRFMHIFFHSGGRERELLRLQGKDVDLVRQRYKSIIKKGRQSQWVEKTIKDAALPFWNEQMANCGPEDYVFSKGLLPGPAGIRADQIPRRWRTWVKIPLNIQADFYSLKHLNLDETSAALSAVEAARVAGHTSTVVTMDHYLVGEKERQHQKLKAVENKFA